MRAFAEVYRWPLVAAAILLALDVFIVERLVDDAIQKRRFALIYQKSILRTQLVHANVECNPFCGRSTLYFHSRRVSRSLST